jgi:predicted enzyme related to lactoylglutathione lyase
MIAGCAFACATLAVAALGRSFADEPGKGPAMKPAFEQFKKLVGDWVTVGDDGKVSDKVTNTFRLAGAGSAVVETMFPGTDHEMVTVYHLDGDDLLLTHYCAAGNQPRMKAERTGDVKTVAFKFAGCTNLKSENDMHMHDATFRFIDNDHVRSEWTNYQDGKAGEHPKFTLVRRKKEAVANRPIHFEIHSPAPDKSMAFFEKIFGWKFNKWNGPQEYWLIQTGDTNPGIDGGIMASRDGQPRTVNTVQVSSVDDYTAKVEAAGGKVVLPKMAITGVGYVAYCTDPGGALFGIAQLDKSAK